MSTKPLLSRAMGRRLAREGKHWGRHTRLVRVKERLNRHGWTWPENGVKAVDRNLQSDFDLTLDVSAGRASSQLIE